MKKTNIIAVLAVTLCLGTASAVSADWEIVTATSAETVLVDKSSIHRDEALWKAWAIRSYKETTYLGDFVYPHKSLVLLYEIDCNTQQLGYAAWSFQAGELGGGQTVWADKAKEVMHFSPGEDAAENAVLRRVCTTSIAHGDEQSDAGESPN